MALITLVLLASILVFIVAFVSPEKGTNTQKRSENVLSKLLQKASSFPRLVRKAITTPPIASHKTISKSAELGKTARKKIEK
jgi:hypothetical protein